MKNNAQQGFILVGLLVGLLISIVCMLTVLSVYKTSVKVGVESRIASQHDSGLQNGLSIAQKQIVSAGYGMDQGESIVVETNLNISQYGKTESANVVLWKYKDGGLHYCQGLADVPNQDKSKRLFVFLKTTTACQEATALKGMDWEQDGVISSLFDYSSDKSNANQMTFELIEKPCTPYGSGRIKSNTVNKVLKITAKTSSQFQNPSLGSVVHETCLLNISVEE